MKKDVNMMKKRKITDHCEGVIKGEGEEGRAE